AASTRRPTPPATLQRATRTWIRDGTPSLCGPRTPPGTSTRARRRPAGTPEPAARQTSDVRRTIRAVRVDPHLHGRAGARARRRNTANRTATDQCLEGDR